PTLNRQLERDAEDVDEDDDPLDATTRLAIAHRSLCDNSRSLDRVQRTEARMARMFERAVALLLKLQSHRPNCPETENCRNEPNPRNEHMPQPVSQPGSADVISTISE